MCFGPRTLSKPRSSLQTTYLQFESLLIPPSPRGLGREPPFPVRQRRLPALRLGTTGNPTPPPPSSHSVNKQSLDRPMPSKTRTLGCQKTNPDLEWKFPIHSETPGVNQLTSRRGKKSPKRRISILSIEGERGTRRKGPGIKGAAFLVSLA